MTYQEKLKKIRDCLVGLNANVYHYWRPNMEPPFILWQEDAGRKLNANNRMAEWTVEGSVDVYSRTEYDPLFDAVMIALDEVGAAWRLDAVMYEDETNLIHYNFEFEVT